MTGKIALAAALGIIGGAAVAQDRLFGDPEFVETLQETMIARHMTDKCDNVSISAEEAARVASETDTTIRAAGYEPEVARDIVARPAFAGPLREAVAYRLADMGVLPEDPETLCVVARRKAGMDDPVGRLLVPE